MKIRIILTVVFAASLGLSSASAELIVDKTWMWRQFAWRNEGGGGYEDISLYDRKGTALPFPTLSDTRYGITLSSTEFTESGFTLTSSATNPTAGKQWSQYVYLEVVVDRPTAFTLSGTLYATNPSPSPSDGLNDQYAELLEWELVDSKWQQTTIFSLTNVVGPQAYFVAGIFEPNKMYDIAAVSTWATPTDGFSGNFMTLTLSEPAPAVPEPGTWAAAALLLGGAAFACWRKRAKEKAET